MMTLAFRPLVAMTLASIACSTAAAPKQKKPVANPVAAAPAACVDFYGHVNQDWLDSHPLPIGTASYSRWNELNASALLQIRQLLDNTARTGRGQANDLLADLAASAADATRLDAGVQATAQPLLARINAVRTAKDITRAVSSLHAAGVPAAFGFDAVPDMQTGQARATFYPAGLGLPDAAYYTSSAPELQRVVAAYRLYLAQILQLAGVSSADVAQQAAWAYDIELAMARQMGAGATDAMTVAQAGRNFPHLLVSEFMPAQGAAPAVVAVSQPGFFRALDAMLSKPTVPKWQAYLRAQVMHALVPAMSTDLRLPYLAALNVPVPAAGSTPAAERLAALARQEAVELVSAAYVERYLVAAQQQRAELIAESVRAAMGRALERASWLSEPSRVESRKKLAAMQLAIGKPNEPVLLSGLQFDRGNFAGNLLLLRRWHRSRSLDRLSSAIWPMPVSQARPVIGYQASENRLVVTSAALQAPGFNASSPASDYGSFGALVAQQMSLGFAGYTETDGRGLAFRQAGLVPQFNAYPAGPVLRVNGQRMQRQNAADLAGVEIAWDAFATQATPSPAASQEFFRAWAGMWARQDSPAALAAAQQESAFAPAQWRANGPLSNMPAFTQAFSCKPGQAMVRPLPEQIAIWR